MPERDLLILESTTPQEEMTAIGVRCGDQYLRLKVKKEHGLAVGEEISFVNGGGKLSTYGGIKLTT